MTRSSEPIDDLLADLPMEGPSSNTRQAIRGAVMADLAPVRGLSAVGRAALVMLTGVLAIVAVVSSYGTASVSGSPPQIIAAAVGGVLVVVAGVALGGALSPAMARLPSRRSRALLVVGLVIAWSAFVFAIAALSAEHGCPYSSWGCLLRTLGTGTVLLGAWLWIWRRSDPWTPRVGGALIGALAGAIASAGGGIACLANSSVHLVVGHWLVVPLLAGAGALLARRAVAP